MKNTICEITIRINDTEKALIFKKLLDDIERISNINMSMSMNIISFDSDQETFHSHVNHGPELSKMLDKAVLVKGNVPVYFDTEGRSFDYHMAEIGGISVENDPIPHICLHEKRS